MKKPNHLRLASSNGATLTTKLKLTHRGIYRSGTDFEVEVVSDGSYFRSNRIGSMALSKQYGIPFGFIDDIPKDQCCYYALDGVCFRFGTLPNDDSALNLLTDVTEQFRSYLPVEASTPPNLQTQLVDGRYYKMRDGEFFIKVAFLPEAGLFVSAAVLSAKAVVLYGLREDIFAQLTEKNTNYLNYFNPTGECVRVGSRLERFPSNDLVEDVTEQVIR